MKEFAQKSAPQKLRILIVLFSPFPKEAEKVMYETARVARRKIENRDFPSDVLTSIDSVVWHRVTGIYFTN